MWPPIHIPFLPNTTLNLNYAAHWGTSPGQIFLGLLLCLAPFALILLLCRYEMRLVKPIVAVTLLGLRLVGLTLLLFILALEPVLAEEVNEILPGHVVIAVDRSDSIFIPDPQRRPADKLKLARALGIGDRTQLDGWLAQYEAKEKQPGLRPENAPRFVSDSELAAPNGTQLMIDRHKVYDEICRQVDGLTRSEVARRILADDGLKVLSTIAGVHQVDLIGFDRDSWDGQTDHLDDFFRPSKAASTGTDLTSPLARAVERSGPDAGKVIAVILLTDGQHNSTSANEGSPETKAKEMGEKKIPIYPVALGYFEAPPNLVVASVKALASMFKDGDLPVDAIVKVSGHPGQKDGAKAQSIEVLLERARVQPNGETTWEVLKKETLLHEGGERTYPVSFPKTRMNEVGKQLLRVSARPTEVDRKAIEKEFPNGQRAFRVNVADDKAKVLVVDGEARYEFHYLAVLLARKKGVALDTVVFQQPRLGKSSEEDLKKIGHPALALPEGADALAPYDCIVLGDVTPEQLPVADRVRLERYVAERGGTLVIQAGKRAMPMAYAAAGGLAGGETDPLLKLLPILRPQIRAWKPDDKVPGSAADEGLGLALTDEGRTSDFLQFDTAHDKNEQAWDDLPPYFWAVTGEAKPGATPLVWIPAGDRVRARKAQPGDEEAARQEGLIVRHSYGYGRVLHVGLDSTWRWRYKTGDTKHNKFWDQLIRWAASDKPLVTGNEFVRFGTREPLYQEGQEVEFVARLGEAVEALGPQAVASARVVKIDKDGKDEVVAVVPLKPREAQPKLLQGKLPQMPAGKYLVELVIPDLAEKLVGPPMSDGTPAKLRSEFEVGGAESPEMMDLRTDVERLKILARNSRPDVVDKPEEVLVYTPENVVELAEKLIKEPIKRTRMIENSLWQEWGILLLLLALLTAEWIGRKWAGLP